jgi:hypothetical protein
MTELSFRQHAYHSLGLQKVEFSEPDLTQIQLMKILIESNQFREMFRAEKSSSNSAHHYLSGFTS